MALILDISNNNASPDWPVVAKHGIKGVWLKATEGRTFTDRTYTERRGEARHAGLAVGAYHFGLVGDAKEEARHFCNVVKRVYTGDMRPVLDLEVATGHSPRAIEQFAREFNHYVMEKLGQWPLFYSYSAFIQQLELKRPLGSGLWLANYSRNDGAEHPFEVPKPWKRCLVHQFTSNARVVGCPSRVDLSHTDHFSALIVK